MAIVRWDPFSEADRAFGRLLRQSFAGLPLISGEGNGGETFKWAPSADISETDKEYLIRAELPAVRKEDVKVTVDGGMITIEGERKQEKEQKSEKFHRIERVYGNFTRSFALPEDSKVAEIRCEDKNGILTIHIPKTATEKPKPTQIKVD